MPAGCLAGPEAAANVPVIKDREDGVASAPGLGIEFNQNYLKANLAPGEPGGIGELRDINLNTRYFS